MSRTPENQDPSFEEFSRSRRRDRIHARLAADGQKNQALSEIERQDRREVLERRLSREMHEFFNEATRRAASILQRVLQENRRDVASQVGVEMESFLRESIEKAEQLIAQLKRRARGKIAVAEVEPSMTNLSSQDLDRFRAQGSTQVAELHAGQKPGTCDVDEANETDLAETPAQAVSALNSTLASALDVLAASGVLDPSQLQAMRDRLRTP